MAGPLLVVDAPSILYRAFYALPSSITDGKGQAVNALLGATNMTLVEVKLHRPRAVVLCFGAEAAKYRVKLLSAYHADREPMPRDLVPQFAQAGEFFGAFGWSSANSRNLEADDLLGSFAEREVKAGGTALLLTGDRDMFQCASRRVKVLYPQPGGKGAAVVGPAEVKERYGIPPKLVPDFIALRGDPSDGIPGAKGVGEKTAAELLRRHGSLEKVLDTAIREPKVGLRKALLGSREELLTFKDIATLRDEKVGRPRDKRTNYAAAAKMARARGMNRLAERLEQK